MPDEYLTIPPIPPAENGQSGTSCEVPDPITVVLPELGLSIPEIDPNCPFFPFPIIPPEIPELCPFGISAQISLNINTSCGGSIGIPVTIENPTNAQGGVDQCNFQIGLSDFYILSMPHTQNLEQYISRKLECACASKNYFLFE